MTPASPGKGLAIASLAFGLVSLVTAGGCGIGALVGLCLGAVALARARKEPGVDSGADVAWAGIVTSVLGVLTLLPVLGLVLALQQTGVLARMGNADDLPEPANPTPLETAGEPPPPPPPRPIEAPPTPAAMPANRGPARRAPSVPPSPLAASVPPNAPAPVVAPMRLDKTIAEPTKVRNVNPIYPGMAKQARVQGKVVLEATIDPAGRVTAVRVMESVPLLDQAAIDAVKQWEYTPTLLDGVAVPVIMTVTLNFRLN